MSNLYLIRMFDYPCAERFEEFCQNPTNYKGIIGKRCSNVIPSVVKNTDRNTTDAKDYVEYMNNCKKTSEISSFFFYGEDLMTLRDYIITLAYEAVGEEALSKKENGEKCEADDFFAYDRPTLAILKIDENKIYDYANAGKLELREGEYNLNDEKSLLQEIAIGDDAMREILTTPNSIMAYGRLKEILNNPEIFPNASPFDSEGIFDEISSNYYPAFEIKPSMSQVESIDLPKPLKDELDNIKMGIDSVDEQDREFLISASIETVLYLANMYKVDPNQCCQYVGIDPTKYSSQDII